MSDDEELLRRESEEIEHLLEDLRALVAPPAWDRIEKLLGRVIRMHGAGLARALAHARDAGANDSLGARLAGDDLVASLLALHGIHPLTVEQRVQRALAEARVELGIAPEMLELVAISDDRVALRAAGPLGGGAMSAHLAESAIRRAIEVAAPEIVRVELAGAALPPAPEKLVQLRVRREGAP